METRFQALYPSSPLQSTIGTLSSSSIQTKKIDDFGKQKRSQQNCRSHQRELQRSWHSFFFFDRTKERKSASGFHRTHINFHRNFLCLNKLFSRFHFFVFSHNPKTPLTRFLSFLHRSCSQSKRHYYSKASKCPILRLLDSSPKHQHVSKYVLFVASSSSSSSCCCCSCFLGTSSLSFCTRNCSKDFQNQRKIAPKKINTKMLPKKLQNQQEIAQKTSKISMKMLKKLPKSACIHR
jgi:hypothetical protein